MPGHGQPSQPRGSAGSFGFAAAGWSLGRWEVVGRMHGHSVGRCWVCLGPVIIYPVPSLVPIPTIFAINSSILAGAGLTSSTSGVSGRARVSPASWSCLRQQSRVAGPTARRSRMRPREGCDSRPASPNPTLPVLPYPNLPQSMDGSTEKFFSQHGASSLGITPVQWGAILSPASHHGTGHVCSRLAALGVPSRSPSSATGLGAGRAREVPGKDSQQAGPKVPELLSGCDMLASHPAACRGPVSHLSSCGRRVPGGSRRSRYSGSCRGC